VDPLSVRQVKNSVVYPTIRVASHPGKLLMGVYDGDDNYVDGTVLDRRSGEQGLPVPRDLFPAVADSHEPEAIYAGPLYFHYGHFLVESLARAWYAAQHPEVPLVWAGAHTWQEYELQPWQGEILHLLGITNPTRIIADPSRFELLHVPDIGFRYPDRFHPEHAAFLGRYQGPAQVPGHRLWLSRSKVGSNVRDLNSAATERRLAYAGWTIAYPEAHSMRQQLDLLARAEIVAGEEGSAFHSLILLKNVASKKFHILRRHGREHGTLHTIGAARRVDQTFHTLEQERVLSAEGRVVFKLNPNSSEILDVLGVPVPAAVDGAAASDGDATLERVLTHVAPRSFLDVGAATPHLVVGAPAPTRVAVSPRFDFDPRTYADSGVDFYELGLIRYANLFHDDRGPFDVIRVTGSEFERVMASFRVSKRLAHEGTTWILGSGELAAKAALAIRLRHPGFTARRLLVQRKTVYIAQRLPGDPVTEAGIGEWSMREVRKRTRWLPLAGIVSGDALDTNGSEPPTLPGALERNERLKRLLVRRKNARLSRGSTPSRLASRAWRE